MVRIFTVELKVLQLAKKISDKSFILARLRKAVESHLRAERFDFARHAENDGVVRVKMPQK